MAKPGSARTGPDVELKWEWFFWDVRTDEESFGKRQLNTGGYENKGKKCALSIGDEGGEVLVRHIEPKGIGELTFDQAGQTVSVKLVPPAGHDSVRSADPDSDSPKATALWNWWCEIQMRELLFQQLEIDADGYFNVTGGKFFDNGTEETIVGIEYDLYTCFVPKSDRDEGLAPHGYLKVFPRHRPKGAKRDKQIVQVDWRFDIFRPNEKRATNLKSMKSHYKGKGKAGKELRNALRNDPDKKRKPWTEKKTYDRKKFDKPFLVIHITDGPRFESQLQTLTSGAAIHYLVCLNGHVVKIVEDAKGCYHAGWENVAVWRDFVWDGKIDCNRTSIGIEHLGAAGVKWPQAEIDGSVRIAKRICEAHKIAPCNVIRHRDLGGSVSGVHVEGKECPGTEAPWWAYQKEGVSLWPLGARAGEIAPTFPTGDAFFHGIFDVETLTFMDDELKDPDNTPANETKQKAAIKELKGYLKLIGYWVTKKNGSNEDVYDTAAEHCVEMCQERFMIAPSKEKGEPDKMPTKAGKVDRETAKVIWAVCQHTSANLPGIQARTSNTVPTDPQQ